jgi:hypothetical protein
MKRLRSALHTGVVATTVMLGTLVASLEWVQTAAAFRQVAINVNHFSSDVGDTLRLDGLTAPAAGHAIGIRITVALDRCERRARD